MLQAAQIRAARALLGWRQDDLAKAAKVGLATVARIEQGEGMVQGNFSTIAKIQQALEREGISFTADQEGGIGVRLARKRQRR
jgi:transcriptional regulator with XRE-family HTH domain